MLLYLCQVFIFLLGHLHFFLHFFFAFMENLFKKHPIQTELVMRVSEPMVIQRSLNMKPQQSNFPCACMGE